MNQEITVPSPGDFKDRKIGLIIFGVLTMCFGGLCAIMVMVMFLAQSLPKQPNVPQNPQALILATAMYGGMAIVLAVLGIGSILARRWARALLLIFSWGWLLIGLFLVAGTLILISSPGFAASMQAARPAGQAAMPVDTMKIFAFVSLGISGVFFLLLPGIWIFFYGSKHVKATCETRNPAPCWTDRCPLPVLAMSISLAFCVPMMLVFPLVYHGVLPFFGVLVSGTPGSIACVILALFWGYSAWALYTLRLHGWWMVFLSMCLFSVSSIITYSRHDITETYRLMGYPEQQIALLQKSNFFQGDRMLWVMLFSVLPWLLYLLWVRKFFGKKAVTN